MNDSAKVIYLSQASSKNWKTVKAMFEFFVETNKPNCVVQFDTPDTLKLRKEIAKQEAIISLLTAELEKSCRCFPNSIVCGNCTLLNKIKELREGYICETK